MKSGTGIKEPIIITTTHCKSKLLPIMDPAIAGPKIPEIDHCKLISELDLPRICSGVKSCISAGFVGAWTISPNAKIS